MSDVSIIIAAHNEELFVERTLRSCLQQNFPKALYDIILIDDGSDDSTLKIVKQFEPEITVLVNDVQMGLTASINRGIRHARSRFIVRVDADDYIHADFLSVLYLFLELNTYMDAIACDYYLVDEHENHVERKDCAADPIGCGIMFRKDRLIAVGLYDESFLMAEELDLRLRFERDWHVHRVELPLYRYRMHAHNMTNVRDEHSTYIEDAKKKHRERGD